jgi:hypothetical protein
MRPWWGEVRLDVPWQTNMRRISAPRIHGNAATTNQTWAASRRLRGLINLPTVIADVDLGVSSLPLFTAKLTYIGTT